LEGKKANIFLSSGEILLCLFAGSADNAYFAGKKGFRGIRGLDPAQAVQNWPIVFGYF